MSWEEVPDDVDAFFKTGELPTTADTPPVDTPPVDTPPTDVAPKEGEPPADPSVVTSVETPTTVNPYADELIRQQQATLDKLTKQLADMQKAQADAAAEAAKPAPIDPEKDPLGYLTQQIKAVGDQVAALQTKQVETQQATTQEQQQRQFIDNVNAQIEAFKAKQPDYLDAYKHLTELRTADYKLRGMTPDQIQAALGRDEIDILQGAAAQRKNPAEVVYALAKQYGYQQKSTQEVPPEKKVESKLDTIKKGLETTGGTRAAPPSTYSTEAVKDMSEGQLNDAVENHWHEMFGKSKSNSIF